MDAQLDQWTKGRTCVVCGHTFSLSEHGTPEAKAAAQHLQDRTLDPAALPPLISRCPQCYGAKAAAAVMRSAAGNAVGPPPTQRSSYNAAQEQRAVAAAMAIGEQMRHAGNEELFYYARNVGGALAVLCLAGIAMVAAYAQMKSGFNPAGWVILLLIIATVGAGSAVWAQRQRRK